MSARLDATTFRRAMMLYAQALRDHRDELDSLNVFPVPDGDTGTNLLLTQHAVEGALAAEPTAERAGGSLAAVCGLVAAASLLGARGNSGVILSQFLRGMCEILEATADRSVRGGDLARALSNGAIEAHRAVARPREGTVLSVARAASEAASERAEDGGAGAADVTDAALAAARASLARTPELLPELRAAGVVDAGGLGFVLLLDAFRAALRDEALSEPVGPFGPVGRSDVEGLRRFEGDRTVGGGAFEVQYLLEATQEAIPGLREALDGLGESLVIVGGGGLYNVHMHTDEPGRAVDIGRAAGVPRDARVAALAGDVASCLAGEAREVREVRSVEQACALVAVVEGDGLVRTFASLGAVVVRGGRRNLPSVGEVIAAIEAAPSAFVVVLADHSSVSAIVARAAREASKETKVVRTRSVPGGLAAAAAFGPSVEIGPNTFAMASAAAACRGGSVARAVRDAQTPIGPVREGAWLGLVGDRVAHVGMDPSEVAVAVAASLMDGMADPEVVTLVVGDDAPDGEPAAIAAAMRSAAARRGTALIVETIAGGQPRFRYLVGLE